MLKIFEKIFLLPIFLLYLQNERQNKDTSHGLRPN